MIDIDRLSKCFFGWMVVNDLSFCIDWGEIVGFFGFNGVGKLIILKMFFGFFVLSVGSVCIFGFDMQDKVCQVQKLIGYLLENVFSYGEMMVEGFFVFVVFICDYSGWEKCWCIDSVMDCMELWDECRSIIEILFKGFKCCVVLVQVIFYDFELFLFDEFIDGFDLNQKYQVW